MQTKIRILATLVQLVIVDGALAQGYFEFKNFDPFNGIDARVFDAAGVPLAGTNYLAALYAGPAPDSLKPSLVAGSATKEAIVPFYTGNGGGYIVSPGPVLVDNVIGGTLAWVQMVAWDARLGETFERARELGLGGYGESELFQARAGFQTGVGFDPEPLIGLKSFSLRPAVRARLINVHREGDQLVFECTTEFKSYQLQRTAELGGPWEDVGVPTTETSFKHPINGAGSFFRVVGLVN